MKVIFLDFDGVINDYITINQINDYNIEVLKNICNLTGAKIVVTSSHKYAYQMTNKKDEFLNNNYYVKVLKENGIDVVDWTPHIKQHEYLYNQREQEILEYLKFHPEVTHFLILDDDYIIESLKEHQIFLDLQSGLRNKHIVSAIKILNGELNFYEDCVDDKLKDIDRLVRMNMILKKILIGELDFYNDCKNENIRKNIEENISKMKEIIFHEVETHKYK